MSDPTDTEKETLTPSEKRGRERVTFSTDPETLVLLGMDDVLQGTVQTCTRQYAAYLLNVVSAAINRRCLWAESYLKAGQVKSLMALESELRKKVQT